MTFYYQLEDGSGDYLLEVPGSGYYLQDFAAPAPYVGSDPTANAAAGGQTLTPYRNVIAVAGTGGDKWGAFGGGITPVSGPLPVLANVSSGVRQANFVMDAKNGLTVHAGMSTATVSGKTADQLSLIHI